MTSHRERPPLHLRPAISRRLTVLVVLVHAAAVVSVAILPIPWYLRLSLAMLVVAGLVYEVRTHLVRELPWAVREAVWESDGSWTLTLASGKQVEARLSPATFVSTWLVVLNFRHGRWRSCSLVLMSDSLDADLLRRLRVRLRMAGQVATNTSVSPV